MNQSHGTRKVAWICKKRKSNLFCYENQNLKRQPSTSGIRVHDTTNYSKEGVCIRFDAVAMPCRCRCATKARIPNPERMDV